MVDSMQDPILHALLQLIRYMADEQDDEDETSTRMDVLEAALLKSSAGMRNRTFGSNY